jgi:hypothetical protein
MRQRDVLASGMHSDKQYANFMRGLSRRLFLISGGIPFGVPLTNEAPAKKETVYHLATKDRDIRMTVEFYDRYSSNGFWFDDRRTGRQFCLNSDGEQKRTCLTNFSGSIAITRYRLRPLSDSRNLLMLREEVRTIDRDSRLNHRPPYERTLELRSGFASDIQAFGVESGTASPPQPSEEQPHEPWCLFRQDLYLGSEGAPFLVIHWKHTLSAIRILDLIPGDQTRLVSP